MFQLNLFFLILDLGKIIVMWKHEHGSDILVDLGIVVM